MDLSHPQGASVNDGIEKELCSLHYSSVEKAVRRVIELGTVAKLDIENAYRIIPDGEKCCMSPVRTEVRSKGGCHGVDV